jgi:phospholipid/cholesterol/gamma-HCH transport system substrate-binding protein
MTERQLQFRVGLFVVVSMLLGAVMIVQFGDLQSYLEEKYTIAVHFEKAPGLRTGVPASMNGISIGEVREVRFDETRGGVLAIIDINAQYGLRKDTAVLLKRSILGDTTLEFAAGASPDPLPPGSLIEGDPPENPLDIVQRLETQVARTMESFELTSHEWERVGANLNSLMDTNQTNIAEVLERTSESLARFSETMTAANETFQNANEIFADADYHKNLKRTLEGLPKLVEETQLAVSAVRQTVATVDAGFANLKEATDPLAKRSESIVSRLDRSMANLELLLGDLQQFSQTVVKKDGTLKKLASDPELYRNLADSSASLSVILKNLEPAMRDLRIFSDKIARHPELIGVGGALKGSSGIKEPESNIRQASGIRGRD